MVIWGLCLLLALTLTQCDRAVNPELGELLRAALSASQDTTSGPLSMVRVSGNGQQAVAGTPLLDPLTVAVTSATGRAASRVLVTFQVTQGTARLTRESSFSDAYGYASTAVLLGAQAGPVTISASLAATGQSVSFTATALAGNDVPNPDSSYVPAQLDDYALRFEADQRQEVAVGLVSVTGDQYTVECWVKLATPPAGEPYTGEIIGQSASDEDFKGTLMVDANQLKMMITTQSGSAWVLRAPSGPSYGRWTHIAGVYDGTEMRLYQDGQEVASMPASGAITGLDLRRSTLLGGYAGTSHLSKWFDGDLDEVRIWSVARTADQLWREMFHEITPQPGLIGYWRFGEGSGSYTADLSGNGHGGQLTNFEGEGAPRWAPGVFTEIDTTAGSN